MALNVDPAVSMTVPQGQKKTKTSAKHVAPKPEVDAENSKTPSGTLAVSNFGSKKKKRSRQSSGDDFKSS